LEATPRFSPAAALNPFVMEEPAAAARPRTAELGRKKGGPRWVVYAAALSGLLVTALLAGVVITVTREDGKASMTIEVNEDGFDVAVDGPKVRVRERGAKGPIKFEVQPGKAYNFKVEKDGFETVTDNFVYKKGDRTLISVTMKKPPEGVPGPLKETAGEGEPNREAAEWVLSLGGNLKVRVGDKAREVTNAEGLPAGPFALTAVSFSGAPGAGKVDDAGLENLKALTGLRHLILNGTRVGDAGLAHLKALTELEFLALKGTRVSDAGLKHLITLTGLRYLELNDTRVGDGGLEHLLVLTSLDSLFLSDTRVSDAGLARLGALTSLKALGLSGPQLSDSGMAHLKALTGLRYLTLNDTRVGDAGLAHLKALTGLQTLGLNGTGVGDRGLEPLKSLKALRQLDLTGTKVTAGGVAALRKALPRCKVVAEHLHK
jgi:hypothetical protein